MSEEFPVTTPATVPHTNTKPYLIPGAIVIAGLIIAGAIVARGDSSPASGKEIAAEVLPVTEADHVFGPANPDVYFIEYSDYQCPFCERFHGTVKDILKEYDGKVAWVYRHFPLDSIHPQARPAAIASECAAELGGPEAFWVFTDKIFEKQRGISEARYKEIAQEMNLDATAFAACLDSDKYDDRINRDLENGQELGGQGTPYNVLLTKEGQVIKFSGALPAAQVKTLVNRALKSLDQ
jgi:protein-disulfide isomerase